MLRFPRMSEHYWTHISCKRNDIFSIQYRVMGKIIKMATPLRITKHIIEAILNLIFLVIWVIAMMTPYISPLKSQIPAFLNIAFAVILLIFVLVWVVYLVSRRWRYFFLYTIVAVASSGFLGVYFPIHFGKGLTNDRDLRVMTYNVAGFGFAMDDDGHTQAEKLIRAKDADIVCLQEGGLYFNYQMDYDFFKKAFGDKYKYINIQPELRLTILSKYPILHSEEVKYPSQTNGTRMYILSLAGERTLLLVNNHMESYSLAKQEKDKFREYLKDFSVKNLPKQMLEVKRRLGPMLNKRAYAARCVKEQVQKYKEEYHPTFTIVLGDFNDTPMSYTYRQLRDGRHDAYAECGLGLGVSFNEHLMPFRIDHLFYEGDLKAIGCDIPTNKMASDHNPLIVDFEYKEE